MSAVAVGEETVKLRVVYFPPGKNAPSAVPVTDSAVTNAHSVDESVPDHKIFTSGHELVSGLNVATLVRENPQLPCTFSVSTDYGSDDYTLEAAVQPISEFILPVYLVVRSGGVEIGGIPDYGSDTLHSAPPYSEDRPNWAQWEIQSPASASYQAYVTYAAAVPRPLTLNINGTVANSAACSLATGGWLPANRQELPQGVVDIDRGRNVIELRREHVFPCIHRIRLTIASGQHSGQ